MFVVPGLDGSPRESPLPRGILVATTLDAQSRIAMIRAHDLARQFDATLHVVHVLPEGVSVLLAPAHEAVVRWAVRETGIALDREDVIIKVGPTARAVEAAAVEVNADLVVTGRPAPRSLRSTTLDDLVHSLSRALLVAELPRNQTEIVAATDFEDRRSPVVTCAAELARALSAQLTVVHNLEPGGPVLAVPFDRTAEAELMEELRARLGVPIRQTLGVPCDAVHTAMAVAAVARERDADLVVVGMRPGHGRTVTRLLAEDPGGSILAIPLPERGAA
jgi:nucleotide-binding universal stress UspA family protein